MFSNESLKASLEALDAKADEILKSVTQEDEDERVEEGQEVETEGDQGREDNSEHSDDNSEEEIEKSDEGEDLEKSDYDDEEEEEDPIEKSATELVDEDEVLQKGFEVSDFLENLVTVVTRSIDSLDNKVEKSISMYKENSNASDILVKSLDSVMESTKTLADLMKSQKQTIESQGELIKSLQDRLENVENQPMPRKASVNVVEKSFGKSAGVGGDGMDQLSKSQKAHILEQAFYDGKLTQDEVLAFDSSELLSERAKAILRQHLS